MYNYKLFTLPFCLKRFLRYRSVMSSTDLLWLRCLPADDRLQFSFRYVGPNGKERLYNFDRPKSEELCKTLERISTNVGKFAHKSRKKPKGNDETDNEKELIAVSLYHDSEAVVPSDIINAEAWADGNILRVGADKFRVVLNRPTVNSVQLPESIMAGFPLFPKVSLEFTEISNCKFVWYRNVLKDTAQNDTGNALNAKVTNAKRKNSQAMEYDWEQIHVGPFYVTTNDDVSRKLKVVCHPASDAESESCSKECISKAEVMAGPGLCPFENRHVYTQEMPAKDSFRIVCYNILADLYTDSDYSRDYLFPYCPTYALSMDYRKQLISKELLGYNSDIICLQEVDKRVFEDDLLPLLSADGFNGLLKLKTGNVNEGMATFYRKSKFRLIAQHDLNMMEAFQSEEMYKDLLEKLSVNESLKVKTLERSSVVQISVLESIDDCSRRVLVATTHLYFHPRCPHVRLIQTAISLRHLQRLVSEYEKEGVRPSVVFCGDFNSYPESGVNQLMVNKRVSANHADWYGGGKEEFVNDMDLSHNFDFISACSYPRYTNYVSTFCACIDYIYVERERLGVGRVVPMPTHEEVTQFTALPNAVFPSDHLALVCDLIWSSGEKPDVVSDQTSETVK